MDESSRCSFKIPKVFENLAATDNSKYTAIQNKKKIFMEYNFIQVTHTKKGLKIN